MSESSSTRLHCAECSTEIFPKKMGAKPKYCPDCAKERLRISRRDYARRAAAGIELPRPARACVVCGEEFIPGRGAGRPSLACPDCRPDLARERVRAWQRAKGHVASGTVLTRTCEPCGARFEWTVTPGRPAWMCEACKKASYLAAAPQRRARNSKRRARLYSAGYERFDDIEIFERDRWKCGICHKKIDKGVQWPNRMCVTLDHIIPVSQGGSHTRANVRAAHYSCNSSRNNRGGNEQLALLG